MNAHGKPVVGSICPLPAGRRPRVLFLTRKWPPAVGGMEVYCRELVGELEKRTDLEVRALPGRPGGRPPSLAALLGFGLAQAARLIVRPPPADIVHGGDLAVWPLLWCLRLRRRGTGMVLSAHGTDIALAHRRGPLGSAYAWYLRLAVRHIPDAVILANSNATARLCKASGFADVRVVPLATRLHRRPVMSNAPEPYLLFTGRLIARKGFGWFVASVLPHIDADIRLRVAGIGWDADENAALDDRRVEFLGPQSADALARLRAEALAIVVPNLDIGAAGFEGFGLAAPEGAADRGVVLAAHVDGIADAVIDGVTGFLLPPGDAGAWVRKIGEIRNWRPAERRAFLRGARRCIADRYSWARVADETVAAYHTLGVMTKAER